MYYCLACLIRWLKKLRPGMEWWRSQASVSETKRQRATEHPLLNELAPYFMEKILKDLETFFSFRVFFLLQYIFFSLY